MSKPSGFSYGWVVVAVGALMTCVGMGAMMSLMAERLRATYDGRSGQYERVEQAAYAR